MRAAREAELDYRVFHPQGRPRNEAEQNGSWHLFSPGTFLVLAFSQDAARCRIYIIYE
jgi:hypothetical protein